MRRYTRRGRPVTGVLPIIKPVGMGSNELLQQVKRQMNARKAGHTGSLDRLASGVLPLCFGEATKLSGYLLNADKQYRARLRLGIRTSTADAEGAIIEERSVPSLDDGTVEAVLERFRGEIEQIPPMHSAVKHKGERLYKLAHRGEVVEREPRRATIYQLSVESLGQTHLDIFVSCSKGTYIRTLGEDIGEALGCGASLWSLRRTAAGPFAEEQSITVEQFEAALAQQCADALLLAPEDALPPDWPRITLTADLAFYVGKGQPVLVPKAPTSGAVKLFAPGSRFIGVGEIIDDGRVAPRRLLKS
ncbi:MAG: tRNA pseudouridine(55) synthase TruB [Gammaproteobacteria bacterium]|nr:tRNA pseudouridine(55) synthase TruB [Gammaproteobacteria bacterium]